ncbi:2OG-Fe(II) oxygenase [Moraxella macacae 0408225]|uniref:2OG-Fe(II) oxygenase n=1 Tax=Moraxella macacae 0408225 TaxID=1230338 RepID=L2F646_9GAMM|nr:2OG-Fe(II) oxygenase [Moraxella macacae]ELA08380.1 2OG-Fe(II) oxygenase [Moraxella macacae 0408225]
MFVTDWHNKINDNHLSSFDQTGVFVLDACFAASDLLALQTESGLLEYQQAHLTNGEQIRAIRGDSIRWIDERCTIGMQYLASIEQLGAFFNQIFFAGIQRSEAHYACYQPGFGYDWHSDNPKGRDERVISAVFYLNDNWADTDGGQIHVLDKSKTLQILTPKANRLVIFDSDLRHKVALTHKTRFSIATWLRRDMGIF